jgi:C-terminal processing protease CtpA/Prc
MRKHIFLPLLSMLLIQCEARQTQANELKLSLEEMSISIDSINNQLRQNYVFPAVADQMATALVANLKQGKYTAIVLPAAFARQLTEDLQAISHDKHLRVVYDPNVIAAERNAVTPEARARLEAERAEEMKRDNYGFQEMKMLEGNIGFLDLRGFMDPTYARETAVAAMNFLCQADALIIDLRNNGGGHPGMIQLISSYFFPEKPVHLNSFYFRPTNETTETWTLASVPGQRRPDMPVYILTSKRTFSAAEEFSYNLKNLKRATLIGETTGGGAHPTGSIIATDKFYVRVPKGRAINPITKTNWEGMGVTPHIAVSSDQALKIAHAKALDGLKKGK